MSCRSRRTRGAAALAAAALLAVTVGACTSDPNSVAAQANSGDRKGFVSGDGSIDTVAPADRDAPLSVSGTTLDGKAWSLAEEKGKVVVLNVWGSWCGPCIAEAADLQKAWAGFSAAGQPVQFMGLNYRDASPANARAFVKSRKITYPSLADDGGRTLLALRGKAVTTPTTLVLDRQGRIAARVSGKVSAITLTTLVGDVLAERLAAS